MPQVKKWNGNSWIGKMTTISLGIFATEAWHISSLVWNSPAHPYYHLVMTNIAFWKIPKINGGYGAFVRWENHLKIWAMASFHGYVRHHRCGVKFSWGTLMASEWVGTRNKHRFHASSPRWNQSLRWNDCAGFPEAHLGAPSRDAETKGHKS